MNEQQMQARIAELEAENERLKNPKFPKAATGCGALIHFRDASGIQHILFSKRGTEHGTGWGISGGGFFEISKAKPYKGGEEVLRHWKECYRELCEEFRDAGTTEDKNDTFEQVMAKASLFTRLVPLHMFECYAKEIDSFVIQTPDDPFNDYHDCNFYSYEVSADVAAQIMVIQGNDERPETAAVPVTAGNVHEVIDGLFHKHEAEPILRLVKALSA
ncbi:MAG: hypothetical protein OSB62_01610 [Alphaproteobacteria bacterium]|nr:hypothetical protein [Alphaproteobacteria bacterium]